MRVHTPNPLLGVAVVTDFLAHHGLTLISAAAAITGIVCSALQTYWKYRENESFLARYRTECFRRWERARDNPL